MATIYDVARKADVSKSTVSLVINKSPLVKEETRQKVLSTIKDLGYRPNPGARSLVTKKTRVIGLIYPDSLNPFFHEIISMVESDLRNDAYTLVSIQAMDSEEEASALEAIIDRRVEGVVCLTSLVAEKTIKGLLKHDIPMVLLEREYEESRRVSSISIDIRKAAWEALSYLIAIGHRRIGLISAPPLSPTIRQRLDTYRDILSRHKIPVTDKMVVECKGTMEGGYKGAERLLRSNPGLTAVFAGNDVMAIGAMKRITEQGMAIPRDISVVGFDDIYISKFLNPSLTTVALPAQSIAHSMSTEIMRLIQGREGRKIPFKHSLIIRDSTRPLAAKEAL